MDSKEINLFEATQINPLYYYKIKHIDLYDETKNILRNNNAKFFRSKLKEKTLLNSSSYLISLENKGINKINIFENGLAISLESDKKLGLSHLSFLGWKKQSTT